MKTDEANPLSPHLQIYRPQITSVLSVLHRISGIALSLGLLCFLIWILSIAAGPEQYLTALQWLTSPLGLTSLSGWAIAFCYHLGNGVRHILWDAGYGFDMPTVRRTGWLVIGFTASAGGVLVMFLLTTSLL